MLALAVVVQWSGNMRAEDQPPLGPGGPMRCWISLQPSHGYREPGMVFGKSSLLVLPSLLWPLSPRAVSVSLQPQCIVLKFLSSHTAALPLLSSS